MKRETTKTIELQGRTFEIRSFDAFTGSYIAFTLMQKMLPMGIEQQTELGDSLPTSRATMTKSEFMAFQRDCLSVVGEVLKGRTAPLLNANGSWGVPDIADNTMLVLLLTIHALAFNVSVFFAEGGLTELQASLKDLLPANIRI